MFCQRSGNGSGHGHNSQPDITTEFYICEKTLSDYTSYRNAKFDQKVISCTSYILAKIYLFERSLFFLSIGINTTCTKSPSSIFSACRSASGIEILPPLWTVVL